MLTIQEYGGFKFDKNEISKVFRLLGENISANKSELIKESGLGKNKVDIIKDYYLKHIGLLNNDSKINELGYLILEYDKYFLEEFTEWILVYEWSKKQNNPILYVLLNYIDFPKNRRQIRQSIEHWLISNNYKTKYQKDYIGGLLSRTLNAMEDENAFCDLNILKLINDKYHRGIPYKLDSLIIAYILYDNASDRTNVNVETILEEKGNIGAFLGFDLELFMQYIYNLRNLSLIKYTQAVNLNNITFIFPKKPIELLKMYYEKHL